MPLHPEARAAVAHAAGAPKVGGPGFSVEATRAADRAAALAQPREDVASVSDVDADGVPCRLYVPEGAADGTVVHLHGGGFVLNDVEVHDGACRRLANRAGLAVLSVDYRRPPEHPFPAAPDDVDSALAWLARERPGPAYAHGDSAGGNLALVAALRHPGLFRAVALVYPFLDPTMASASYDTAEDGFGREEAGWYWQQYAASATDLTDPDLAPLLSDRLGTLPPTLVVTAEEDPLRDEGEHLVHLLAEAGVAVVGTRYLGQVHGFWRHTDVFPAAEPLMQQVAGFLRLHP